MKELDRRVRRTRNALSQSLRELIVEKGYEATTIEHITDRADLNRATFYLHYTNKEELLMAMLESQFDELVQHMEATLQGQPIWENLPGAQIIFDHVAENVSLYKVLLGENGFGYVINRVMAYMAAYDEKELRRYFKDEDLPLPIPLVARHISGSLFALLTWWLENDMPYSPQFMAMAVQKLCIGAWWMPQPGKAISD